MATAELGPEVHADPNVREIGGRVIEREYRHGGGIIWREVHREPAWTEHYHDKVSGLSQVRRHHGKQAVLWSAGLDPGETVQSLTSQHGRWRQFDPRAPSPIHEEMDRAIAAGFEAWAAQLAAMAKLRPRQPMTGLTLGRCYRSHGTVKAYMGDDDCRALLNQHANGDYGDHGKLSDVTLDDDRRFCPMLFGPAVVNGYSIETGHGLVTSLYTRGPERVKVVTPIGAEEATYIYVPTRDAMG